MWLMYHDVYEQAARAAVPKSASVYHVSRELFAAHLEAIARSGHRIVTAGECIEGAASSHDSVVLTFDDGWVGAFEIAQPMLLERGWRATIFVTKDFIGRQHFCTRETLRAAADAGMEIGVHGVTHRMLSHCTRNEVIEEFRVCREYLEALLGRAVTHASIPGGDSSATVVACAREAGMTSLSTSRPGVNRGTVSPYDVRRMAIKESTRAGDVQRYCQFRVAAEQARWALMQLPRRALGMQRYSQLRRMVLRSRGTETVEVFKP